MGLEDIAGSGVCAFDQSLDFGIDQLVGFVRSHRPNGLPHAEISILAGLVLERAELVAHAPTGHHIARQISGILDVGRCAGRHLVVTEDDFLRHAPAHRNRKVRVHFIAVIGIAVPFWQAHYHAQRAATRDNGGLVDWVGSVFVDRDDRMAGFVIGGHFLFVVGHHHRSAFRAHHHLVLGVFKLLHRYQPLVPACGQQGSFVDEVGKVCARKSGRAARDHPRVDVGCQRHLFHMHTENLLAPVDIGDRHHHLTVKPARAQQRRVEHVGAVGRGDDDDAFVGFKPVHLDQQLVERLFAFVVRIAEAIAARTAHRVDFVDEDDAGRILLGLFEHVAHAARADANEHFDEVRTRNGEERHTRFACDGAGEQGLAGARRTDQQCALGDLPAELGKTLRIAQEFNDFLQFLARFVDPGDIIECHLARTFRQQLGLGLAKAHGPAAAALLHLPQRKKRDAEDQDKRQRLEQDEQQHALLFALLAGELHSVVFHQLCDVDVVGDRYSGEGFAVLERAGDEFITHLHIFHFAFGHSGAEIRIADRGAGGLRGIAEHRHHQKQGKENTAPDHQLFDPGVGAIALRLGVVLIAHCTGILSSPTM